MARWLLLPISLAALPACGGTDEGRPDGSPTRNDSGTDPCKADDGYEFQTVVNFEPRQQGSQTVRTAACEAQTPCSFYFNYDDAQSPANPDAPRPQGADCDNPVDPDAVVFSDPRIAQGTFVGQDVPGGRCGEEQSGLHVIATNVGMCYGPDGRLGWGAALDVTFSPSLDARDWDGISVWARSSSGTQAIILSVADPFTSGGLADPDTGLPYCNSTDPPPGAPPIPDSQKCDAFGTAVTMTDKWTFVPARFAALRQKGFGVPSVLGHVDTESISRVQLLMSAGSWDYWIDEIALFRAVE